MSSREHELKDEEFRHYQRAFKDRSDIPGSMLALQLARVLSYTLGAEHEESFLPG